jgi:hypothetical protein
MKQCFSNATVSWNEQEITRRENLIREIPVLLFNSWRDLNPAIQIERCETPMLVPANILKEHIDAGFELINTGSRGYLRPETTKGTYEVFKDKFTESQLKKRLPYCMWQVGCSFRDEANPDTMRATKLRLVQFYQLEFQIFTSHDTKADYLKRSIDTLIKAYGGESIEPDDLPHYSQRTIDWMIDDLEVAGLSIRNDWEHGIVFEIAIGLDRLVAMQMK